MNDTGSNELRQFELAVLSRSLAGKRTNLKTVLEKIDRFDKALGESPLKLYSKTCRARTYRHPGKIQNVQFDVARLEIDHSTTKFGEPIFGIIGGHYIFQNRWITFTREVAPLLISFHALKRMAQRFPDFEVHAYGALQHLEAVLPFLETMSIILSNAADKGDLPNWSCVPLPVQHGVFLTELVKDPFTRRTDRFGVRFDKHGNRQIPKAINHDRTTLKISTFLSNDMLSKGQIVDVDRLVKLFSSWPEMYEKLTRFDSEGYETEFASDTKIAARNLISGVRPQELKRTFQHISKRVPT